MNSSPWQLYMAGNQSFFNRINMVDVIRRRSSEMKPADEWQELTNILSNLIAKYACVLSGMPVHQRDDKPELPPDEATMPKVAIA